MAQQKQTPAEQLYATIQAQAEVILATEADPSQLDEQFFREGVNLAMTGKIYPLGSEVVKIALQQVVENPSDDLSPHLAAYHLATIADGADKMIRAQSN